VVSFFIGPAIASLECDQVLILERDSAWTRLVEDFDFEVDRATSQELSRNLSPVRRDNLISILSTDAPDLSDSGMNLTFLQLEVMIHHFPLGKNSCFTSKWGRITSSRSSRW
jgi:hypothetical protein